ncbi:MAG: sugar phosphate isomerase/epimerase [Planctomycetota bacterium]|nr:sugar phosphate isomerase/epimerase [Planctomycetota bacterium]
MKLSVQTGLLPGNELPDKLKWAADHGVEGIEISAWQYRPPNLDQALRDYENSPLPVSTICGNASFDFVDPDPKKRRQSIDESKQYLELAGKLGAVGQIVVPIFGPARINDLSPYKTAVDLEKELFSLICQELGEHAEKHKVLVLLEPLNRYEQHLLRKQADGVEACKRCGHASVQLMSDFFHMHIEEENTPQALREAGGYVKHVHLADNTRKEPGTGDIDFVAGFKALLEIGFTGYMAYECSISGNDKAAALAKSLDYMRACIKKAKGG